MFFTIVDRPIQPHARKESLQTLSAGAYTEFEGRVRDRARGRTVQKLDYEAYRDLAEAEGERVLQEIVEQFDVLDVGCVHRVGSLELGAVAVWIGVVSVHRADAFRACSYAIDEIKARLPIWKRETYASGEAEWVNGCRCRAAPSSDDHEGSASEK